VEGNFSWQQHRKIGQPLVQWRSVLAELEETASAQLPAVQMYLLERVCLIVEERMSLEGFLIQQ
jgi:hypothetical protein